MLGSNGGGIGLLIIDDKTSFFFVANNSVLYVDTHSHNPHGALVAKCDTGSLDSFCQFVWELEAHNEETFGNLVIVKYPVNDDENRS